MPTLLLRSPSKLNLFLKVLGQRPDRFHDLETIFERINLCDEIRLVTNSSGKIKIVCPHLQVPKGPKNLVYQVARMLQTQCGVGQGVTIYIKKNIPVAAGLAGGSSNAATTLLGLNQIWKLGLSSNQLVDFGARIGSDVAFFLYDASWALGQGRGERITPLKIQQKLWHVVVVPHMRMYSKAVFAGLNLKLTKKEADVSILTLALQKKSVFQAGDLLHNDLETSILSIAPRLARVKERLCQYGFDGVVFSGSGPACYGLAASEKAARTAARDLRRYYSRVFVVDTL